MKVESIITGASLLTPLGNTPKSFHTALCEGRTALRLVEEMDGRVVSPPRPAAPYEAFDAKAFLGEQNFKPLDRSSRMAIAAVDLALTDGGWDKALLEETEMDLVVGTMFCNVRTIIQFDRSVLETGPKYAKPLDFANTVINAAGGQTAIWHNLRGANTTVAGGKVSGLRAIRHARLQQDRGATAPVLVGGLEALSFEMLEVFGQAGALGDSLESAQPFGRDRTGFALGEGAAFIIMEDGESAAARGAGSRGRILGMGSSYDISRGEDPDNATTRLGDSIRQALSEAGLTPGDLDFVINSGNGSPREDAIEAAALDNMLTGRAAPLPTLSLAGYAGETLGASGLLQVVTALEILRTGRFPGNAQRGLEAASLTVPDRTISGTYERGLVVALGMDGSSSALIIARP